MAAFFLGHAAVTGRGRRSGDRGTAPERFLRVCRKRTEAHARDRDRDLQHDGFLRVACAKRHICAAALAITFERIAADRSAEEQQVVEMWQLALGTKPADVIDTGRSRA